MNEEKEEEEEEEEDEDALSWQLPGPRKYSRLNSPSAGDEVEGSIPPGAGRSFDPDDDGAIHEEEEEQEEEEEDDDDEAESGVEAASSRRLVLRRDASRSKAEEEATDAAMALGKVSLGVVPEEDTTAVLAEGDRTRLLEGGTDAEPSDGTSPDEALDKLEGTGRGPRGESNPRPLRSRRRRARRRRRRGGNDGPETRQPATGEVRARTRRGRGRGFDSPRRRPRVIFPTGGAPRSYALRHLPGVARRGGGAVDRPDGASGRVVVGTSTRRARTPAEALRDEILGIELRVSRLQADHPIKTQPSEGGRARGSDAEGVRVRGRRCDERRQSLRPAHTHERKRERERETLTTRLVSAHEKMRRASLGARRSGRRLDGTFTAAADRGHPKTHAKRIQHASRR